MNKKQEELYVALVILMVIGVTGYLAFDIKERFLTFSQQLTGAGCQTVRPYFGSINCEEHPKTFETIRKANNEFTCNPDLDDCQTKNIIGLNKLLNEPKSRYCGLTAIGMRIGLYDETTNNFIHQCSRGDFLTDVQGCQNEINSGKQIPDGHTVTFQMLCRYVAGTGPIDNEHDFQTTYEATQEHFVLNVDAGDSPLRNTFGCKKDELFNPDAVNLPDPVDLPPQGVLNTLKNIPGRVLSLLGDSNYDNIRSQPNPYETATDLQRGDPAIWVPYDWVARPGLIIDEYDGKDVWCDPASKNLVEMREINPDGVCYNIPYNIVEQVECCNNADCQAIDPDMQCNPDFQCEKGIETDCPYGQYQCGAIQETCSYESFNNRYVLKETNVCVNQQCQSGDTREVPCCPGSCPAGEYCDYESGCTGITQACPPGKCCTGGPYTTTTCSDIGEEGDECCVSSGYVGDCRRNCNTLDPCDDYPWYDLERTFECQGFTGMGKLIGGPLAGLIVFVLALTNLRKLLGRKDMWLVWPLSLGFAGVSALLVYIFVWPMIIALIAVVLLILILNVIIPG